MSHNKTESNHRGTHHLNLRQHYSGEETSWKGALKTFCANEEFPGLGSGYNCKLYCENGLAHHETSGGWVCVLLCIGQAKELL